MSSEPLRIWVHGLPKIDFADRIERISLAPMVRPLVEAAHGHPIQAAEGSSLRTHYALTSPEDAEVAVLPQAYERTDLAEIADAVRRAEVHGLRTLIFSRDDLEPVLPWRSAILVHPGPTRGAQPMADSLAFPSVVGDRTRWPEHRPDGPRPSVAFCGQGASRAWASAYRFISRGAGRVRTRLRPSEQRKVQPPLKGHVGLRASALRHLAAHGGVDDRFLIRDRYLAGVSTEEERLRAQADFDDNLRSATYALCVRGTGNYSTRFYEALCFGRVPLLVDTAGKLPFEDQIDWGEHIVRVAQTDLRNIGDLLVEGHPEVLADPRRSAEALHTLWEDWLSDDAAFGRLPTTVRRLL